MNIEREYSVVGSWEDTNVTLAVLEAYIPRFFTKARQVYYNKTEKFTINNVSHDTHLDEDVEAYLRASFSFEIELYQFIKQRLYKQYIAVHKDEFSP
ncbi:heparan sulfate 2-O-sulfotransferase pipe-like [Drosophila ananassae]|nr:heparan sulfate 2-O-sulfotransferase pipe-like [Drosophila ananassae]